MPPRPILNSAKKFYTACQFDLSSNLSIVCSRLLIVIQKEVPFKRKVPIYLFFWLIVKKAFKIAYVLLKLMHLHQAAVFELLRSD